MARKRAHKVAAKRGRPRKIEAMGPTPELMAKKLALVGPGGDPTLAAYPVGVLLARGFATRDMHDAATYYAYIAGRILGKIHPGPVAHGFYNPHGDDKAQEIIEPLWRDACAALMGVSRRAKDAVDNVAVYQRYPAFLWCDHRPVDPQLIAGLDALAMWWTRGRLKVA
jgi:hypothetical protein